MEETVQIATILRVAILHTRHTSHVWTTDYFLYTQEMLTHRLGRERKKFMHPGILNRQTEPTRNQIVQIIGLSEKQKHVFQKAMCHSRPFIAPALCLSKTGSTFSSNELGMDE